METVLVHFSNIYFKNCWGNICKFSRTFPPNYKRNTHAFLTIFSIDYKDNTLDFIRLDTLVVGFFQRKCLKYIEILIVNFQGYFTETLEKMFMRFLKIFSEKKLDIQNIRKFNISLTNFVNKFRNSRGNIPGFLRIIFSIYCCNIHGFLKINYIFNIGIFFKDMFHS